MKTYNNYKGMKSTARLISLVLLLCMAVGNAWGETTYRLSAVNSVTAGNKYVFVRENRALIGTVSSKAYQTTDTYSTSSLLGTENYVWTLETAENGYNIKNCSTSKYLNNKSGETEMQDGVSANADWTITFSNNVALFTNTSNSNRFLGETTSTSNVYKAYANSSQNLGNYGHDFTVYELVEEGECESDPTIGNPTFTSISEGSITVSCPSISAGTYCSIEDYGFVWKASSDPTIDDNKTQKGTNNQSSAYSQTLSIDFTTGVTYYFKAYATNGNSTSLSGTALQVTPQSVAFNSNGGSEVATIYVNRGLEASAPTAPTKTGYQFANWCTTSGLDANVDWSSAISANKLYYAKWTPNSYSVVFNKNGGQGDNMPNQAFSYDAAQNLSTNTYEPAAGSHKYFAGWATSTQNANAGTVEYADGASVSNLTGTNNGTVTLYAVWKDHTYTNYRTTCCTKYAITQAAVIGGTLDIEGDKAEACADESIALTATPDEDHVGGTIKVIRTGSNPEEDVTATYYNAGTGKLTMPAFGVTVSATFAEPSSPLLVVSGEALDENTLAFGDQGKDQTSAGRSFTITGSNLAADVTWALSGDDASMFAVTPASPLSQSAVSAGQEITVTFTPTGIGEKSATLTFSSTGAPAKAIALTGTGKWVVSWVANDGESAFATTLCADGETPTLPDGTLTSCDGTSTAFAGWTQTKWIGKLSQTEVDAKAGAEKVYTSAAGMPAVTANTTYHAVFAVRTQTGVEAVKAQTLQYDTWTYSGNTTDKSNKSYRLFHTGSYIESAAFDLSTLNKVIVYGGTFGGDANNSLTIGDGTNTWKDVTVSGDSQTGKNEFTDGNALLGTHALRVTCNSGSDANKGVRISKVEIYVNSPVYSYSDYMTTCRDDVHAITIADGIEGGTVNAAKWGLEGEPVTLTATPNDGYNFGSWNVTKTGDAGTVVPVENNAFNMPAYDVTVSATFAPKPMESLTLSATELTKSLEEGSTTLIVTAYTPTDLLESQKTLNWSSSNEGVATVNNNGEISFVSAGTANITAAWTQDENIMATCALTIFAWNATGVYDVTTAPATNYTDIQSFNKQNIVIKEKYVRSDDNNNIEWRILAVDAWTAKLNGAEIAKNEPYTFKTDDNGYVLALFIGESTTPVWSETITVVEETKDRFVDNLWGNATIVKTGENYTLPTLTERPGDAGTCSDHTTFAGWVEASKADNPTAGDIETGNHTAANKTFYAVWSKSENVNKDETITKSTGFVATGTTLNSDISYSTATNNSNNAPFVANNGHLRLYKPTTGNNGNSITFAASENMTLKKVELSTSSGSYKYVESSSISSGLINGEISDGKLIRDNLSNRYLSIVNVGNGSIEISEMKVTYTKTVTEIDYITDCDPRYDVQFDSNGGEGSYDKVTKKTGVEITLPDGTALSKEHHTFKGWTEDAEGEGYLYTTTYTVPSENKTLYAQWDEDHHAFVHFMNGENEVAGSPIKVYDGGTFDLLGAQTAGGKAFIGWMWNGNKYKEGQTSQQIGNPAEDRTYTATWMPIIDVATANTADLSDGKWILVQNKSQLKAGDFIVIAAAGYDVAMSNYQKNSNRAEAAVTKNNDTLSYTSNVAPLFLQYDPENDYYAFYDRAYDTNNDGTADGSGYLYSDNNLKTQATDIKGFQGVWSISIADKKASIVAQGNNDEKIMRYNSGDKLFNCYGSTTQKDIAIYKWAKNISSDMNVSDISNTDMVIVKNGATLTVGAASTLDNLTVETGGKVVLNSYQLIVNDFVLEGTQGHSGQVTGADHLDIEGDAYFDFTLAVSGETAANQWHNFSVPFPVDVMNGVYNAATGEKLTNEVDYAIEVYHGDKRANGEYGWKKYTGVMQPGVAYSMTVNGDIQTFRFKKTAASYSFAANPAAPYTAYSGKGETTDQGWNGLANMRLCYATVATTYLAQVLDAHTYMYKTVEVNNTNFTVGAAFFIQAGEDGSLTFSTSIYGGGALYYAPRKVTEANERVTVTLSNGENEDYLYLTASDEALSEYQIGHDLQKMFASTTPNAPMLYSRNYGIRLAAEYAPFANNQADYDVVLYAPSAGTYTISATPADNRTVYLTHEGTIIWNLSEGAYEAEMTQGYDTSYGIRIINAEGIATGVENVQGDNVQCTKVVMDDHVYILRGEKMYDVTGKMVK